MRMLVHTSAVCNTVAYYSYRDVSVDANQLVYITLSLHARCFWREHTRSFVSLFHQCSTVAPCTPKLIYFAPAEPVYPDSWYG